MSASTHSESRLAGSHGSLPDWADQIDLLRPVGEKMLALAAQPDDPLERQELWRTLWATLAQGYVVRTVADPNYPEFVPFLSMAFNIGALVPDFMYLYAEINGAGAYRLRGFRNSNHFTDIMVGPGIWALGTQGPPLGQWSLDDDATIGPDGAFDVLLSAERPKDYEGDWWPLDPKATRVTVRNMSYDWVNERDALITIERVDAPARRPRMNAEHLSSRMMELARWTETGLGYFLAHLKKSREEGIVNKLAVYDWSSVGGVGGQIFMEGLFDIAEDECLILESEIPKCMYWSFLVGDNQFATTDWMNHQSSLNGHQAKLDGDGKFRGVVARSDPGVPNWLDTGGTGQGYIQVRWNRTESRPLPTAKKVKLAELRQHLPADTPVVTQAERDAALRERRFGAQLRRRW